MTCCEGAHAATKGHETDFISDHAPCCGTCACGCCLAHRQGESAAAATVISVAGEEAFPIEGNWGHACTVDAAAESPTGSGAAGPHDAADIQGHDDYRFKAIYYVCGRWSEGTWKRAR